MKVYTIFLICIALIPAIVLCVYIYKKDRVEKEPIGLLVLLLALGVLICFPAGMIEALLDELIFGFFGRFGTESNGIVYLGSFWYRVYYVFENFLNIALVEEGLKFLVLLLVTKNNKNFNSMFDGMIYAVFVSIGFAGYENIGYVLDYGFETALHRAFTSVPGHMFFAVIMGYYYSYWHLFKRVGVFENLLKKRGFISEVYQPKKTGRLLALALIMPVLAHGFYDYCLSIESTVSMIAFNVFLMLMYFHCFAKIKKFSAKDRYTDNLAIALVTKKHPQTQEYFLNKQ